MSTRTTHRRMLAATEPKPSKHSTYLDPPSLPSKPSSTSNPTSRVNASQRLRSSQSLTDTRLQAKSMSASMDSSKSFLKSNPHPKSFDPRSEKQSKKTEESEKPKKPSRDVVAVVNKKKEAQNGLVGFEEKKKFDSGRRLSVSSAASGGGGGGGRRKSLSGPQVQLADVLASNGVRVVSADMPPFMQIHAVECARKTHDSLEKFTSKTLALTLKKEFDGVYGPAWHCIVGTSFGSFVTHSVSGFLYFSMDQKLYILCLRPMYKAD
ncbi:hypothetical protein D8674_029689 [Pyrus ussuriensis x Pyrus communis]|uniref:Dynein light chain n=1 Tax=Pyrus ussuriensis x Pyrus communis TaxID=2448454 RepID=A0A5N5I4V4_9ROSA|nr:hypothetical protein D8674_029689 [Pyrus ussuriensis x Pyrus communis]